MEGCGWRDVECSSVSFMWAESGSNLSLTISNDELFVWIQ